MAEVTSVESSAKPAAQTQAGLRAADVDGAAEWTECYHCGAPCPAPPIRHQDKSFCCHGCLAVYRLLTANGLQHFYDLGPAAGVRVQAAPPPGRFAFLDDPTVRERLLDFADAKTSRVTLHIPAIHCIACVWLLENLFRLRPGVGRSQVNFPKREVSIIFEPGRVPLSELVALLASLGYEPAFHLATLETRRPASFRRRLWLRLGVAGFAFGNIMLLSLPLYLGLEATGSPGPKAFFGGLSLLLALPVLLYSASDYWRSAWVCWRQRVLTIDLPIAAGLLALYAQSAAEILAGRGGYLDSLAGLVFFLLCGRLFQQRTYERLAFDRDYKSFFPLAVIRKRAEGEESVPLSKLAVGDHLWVRHGELIPADARLISGQGLIDYSFVTGEAEAAARIAGDYLYAGGRQTGGALEVEIVKPVSESYLTSLWGQPAFAKERQDTLDTLTNRYSRRFTVTVAAVALGAAAYWSALGDPARGLQAFTAVLIVACPCALALAAPFALGTAQRLLARRRFYVKSPQVVETLAKIDTLVFDKTGTLTVPNASRVEFQGGRLTEPERAWVRALARHSTHPHSARLVAAFPEPAPAVQAADSALEVRPFREAVGEGIEGVVAGHAVLLGSSRWLAAHGLEPLPDPAAAGPAVQVAIDGSVRGQFQLASELRPQIEGLMAGLSADYDLALLSGDRAQDQERYGALLGPAASVHFRQSPQDKLDFIQRLQRAGKTVLMVGDGLNDAGALRQSDAGAAVVEHTGAFSPASDVILDARALPGLGAVLRFSRLAVRVVWVSLVLSSLYNVVGVSIAARGLLSPLICAILMPLSSFTVVAFACGAAHWAFARAGVASFPGESRGDEEP